MDFSFTPEQESFRAEVREFLADWRDVDGFMCQGRAWPRVREMFRAMGERGWLALVWPREHGGLGAGLIEEFILWDEVAYARAARNPLAAGIVAKTLIRHGSDEQKRRWLPPIRSGDAHFSLAYSEPEAGSDLASLRTRAERRGDAYVVNGQKCWQSYTHDMDYLWLLARTGAPESRGRGLSLFIVDKNAPGVTVRPLPTMDGDQLHEIFFENVEIPERQRVGPENGAWGIMGEALADERHIQFPPGRVRKDYEDVVGFVATLARDSRWNAVRVAATRERLAELSVLALEVEMHALRVLDAMARGVSAVADAAANKVAHTIACQKIARAAFDLGGAAALADPRIRLIWQVATYETIGGGTSEIMRGIVARQSLGLDAT
ncbi:MAG: acyl-CoA dehydrogenase family protein [Deltaproteobacteria bacterium]|nr:acyl-CoA dehydrogenase family protein [Deltaproteobacteria bacterium]